MPSWQINSMFPQPMCFSWFSIKQYPFHSFAKRNSILELSNSNIHAEAIIQVRQSHLRKLHQLDLQRQQASPLMTRNPGDEFISTWQLHSLQFDDSRKIWGSQNDWLSFRIDPNFSCTLECAAHFTLASRENDCVTINSHASTQICAYPRAILKSKVAQSVLKNSQIGPLHGDNLQY